MIAKKNPLHVGKPRTQLKAQYRTLRPIVRENTWSRDGGRCRCPCHRPLYLRTDNVFQLANIHERRGGAHRAEEAVDVSLKSTLTLAPECHIAVTRKQLRIACADLEELFNGPVEFTGKLATGQLLAEPYYSHPVISPREARQEGDL